jgi:hypothetical protein
MMLPIQFWRYNAGDCLVQVDIGVHDVDHVLLISDIYGSIHEIHFFSDSKANY